MSQPHAIRIRGARQNNLKNLDLDIPLNRMTVITGVSGSGKSSLAFDTLYAEGQRRYVETFSPYARQFMDRMDRPQADTIQGVPPAIAIDRKDPVRTSRSTVGTMTELTDYVKLLYARQAVLHCRGCGRPVRNDSAEQIWQTLLRELDHRRVTLTFAYAVGGDPRAARDELLALGYDRIWSADGVAELRDRPLPPPDSLLNVVADRLAIAPDQRSRAIDSLEMALRMGTGRVDARPQDGSPLAFSRKLHCAYCDIAYAPPLPSLFSFNSPVGACEHCRGFGRIIDVDLDLVIPDRRLSLAEGAIKPFGSRADNRTEYQDLERFCRRRGIDLETPYADLADAQQDAVVEGGSGFYGIRGFFKWLEGKTYKMHVRVYLSRFRSYNQCSACNGTRFTPETLLYRLGGLRISDVYALNVDQALSFFTDMDLAGADEATHLVLEEILGRLRFLRDVGLGYLTLDRQSRTLSGGEVQRVALASSLGASLVHSLYVLDEPSIGLHPRDSERLIRILHRLRDLPNTVVVVEHDPAIILSADDVLDMGPGAGAQGGQVMYFGPTAQCVDSPTGQYLSGRREIPVPPWRRECQDAQWLTIQGAAEHNLKNIDLRIPLGRLVCLTGVSGSGKSTLAEEILYKGLKRHLGEDDGKPGRFERISGADPVRQVELVDQRPIGRTPRANVLTYTKALDPLRKLLAETASARERGLTAGHFSFNVDGGRCDTCKGEGFEKVEMQFLSDVYISCPECGGKRFKPDVLAVTYNGLNISDLLDLTVAQALAFFEDQRKVRHALQPLALVGLGYIRLGQPISTFSGGEAQRLKLSRYLGQSGGDRLLIFDEPTTGLHFQDIAVLLDVMQALVRQGTSLVVIEHNLDVIKCADWVIDLGPEGGDDGGRIVAQGTPEQIVRAPQSHTGRFLRPYIEGKPPETGAPEPARAQHQAGAAAIQVRGAREHNLKNVDLAIPHNQLVVFTGVSGSGKSTLAFDILFAEGQRRYLESLAPFVRQYMKVLERPEVDLVTGLSPTVAIEQRVSHSSRRSTVATLTEVYHFLRLLFSKLGSAHCPKCLRPLTRQTRAELLEQIRTRFGRSEVMLLAPKVAGRKGFHKEVLARAFQQGFVQARIDGRLTPLKPGMALSRFHDHTIDIVIGSVPKGRGASARLEQSVETALSEGNGSLSVYLPETGAEETFSIHGRCPTCGIGAIQNDPRLFSFNSPQGACAQCHGLGVVGVVEEDEESRPGEVCPACQGSRLNAQALAVQIQGRTIWDLVRRPAEALAAELVQLRFSDHQRPLSDPILRELESRLALMNRLGLGYLPLSRSGETLSGGEAQRVRLAAQLGSTLTGVTYILDEPTIGLHARDNHILVDALRSLRDRGNTIVVVEHDEETIRAADTIIDMGPGAGRHGGEVVACGSLETIRATARSVTGALLEHHEGGITSRLRPYRERPALTIGGAAVHNLKQIDVTLPLTCLVAVTGVSGSGKSSLVKGVLYQGVHRRLEKNPRARKKIDGARIEGWQALARVLEVDHTPIGRTPRSVPASYVGFLNDIRQLLAQTPEARARGFDAARFSFNLEAGRCPACKGQGRPKVEMAFLPDVYVPCEVCRGSRYTAETLEVRFKGRSMADILNMTFAEAVQFFSAVPRLRRALELVCAIGLGYLQLGQPSPTLSGGEAQRIKLAREMVKPAAGHTLYILDEPTTGLHPADVHRLLDVLQGLVDQGHTVVTIEHNMEVIKAADYIIDLGPEGGEAGGKLVACGSPPELLKKVRQSHTAKYLKRHLAMT